MTTSEDLETWRRANGYVSARQLPDGRILAVAPQTFGKFRLNVGTMHQVMDGY